MKFEQQVCSLELAHKLKELGVKKKSLIGYIGRQLYLDAERKPIQHASNCVATFTVAELGEMLPSGFDTFRLEGDPRWHAEDPNGISIIHQTTEADARAKMLIYLIENDLLKP
jgi:hypothetical protein